MMDRSSAAADGPGAPDGGPRAWAGRAVEQTGDEGFLAVVQATVDGILVVDGRGEVLFANQAAESLLGRRLDELQEAPLGLPLSGTGGLAQLDVSSSGLSLVVEMHEVPVRWRGRDARVVTLRDVTARVAAQRQLARSEERFALSARGANDGLWDWDRETGLVHTSARLQEMLGYQPRDREEDLQRLLGLVHPEDLPGLLQAVERHVRREVNQFRHECRLRQRNGSWMWVMVRGMAVGQGSDVWRFAGSVTDVSDRKQAEESLRRLALRDALTGLANRALFLDHLQGAIERHRRSGTTFAVLFFDLDRFKLVNDSLGHAVGDTVLVEVGRRLEQCVRTTDTVARLGGDEFAVLLDSPENLDTVLTTVQRIRAAIASPIHAGPHVVYTTASIGIARSDDVPPDPDTALRYADIAMYQAKGAGPNAYQVFAAAMHAQAASQLRLQGELRAAARHGGLVTWYQPMVDLTDGRVVGFEALLRWRRAGGQVLDAGEFIDAAEEIDVIVSTGATVLATAARQLRDWRAEGFDVKVTVNVSERQFLEGDLADRVTAVVTELGLEGEYIGLEITERTAMVHAEDALPQLDRLRGLGLGILVDDFGTGYSSLAAIHHLPLTAVKIDKSFVDGLQEDGTRDIVAAIVALARSLRLDVVAEGIETSDQRDRLMALGCRRGQGYLYGRAMDGDRATRLLRAQAGGGPRPRGSRTGPPR